MRVFVAAALTGAPIPVAGMADTPPPAGAMKLSALLAAFENRAGAGIACIGEVERDDDGCQEVRHHTPEGAKARIRLDPMTGQPRT